MRDYALTTLAAGAIGGDEPRSGSLPDVPGLSKGHKRTDPNHTRLKLELWKGGSLVTLQGCRGVMPTNEDREPAKRDKISSFSAKSRLNMRRALGRLLTSALLESSSITLTYPSEFPAASQPEIYKAHLKRFNQQLKREFGASVVWKLEFQKRGAAHYHLLVFGLPDGSIEWVSETWYRIVGSEDPLHLAAGTKLERIRTLNGAVAYMSKYISKGDQEAGGVHTGRYWGLFNRGALPMAERSHILVSNLDAHRLRRIMRKKIRSDVRRSQWAKKLIELGDDNQLRVSTPYELERYLQLARSGSKKPFHCQWWGAHPLEHYRCQMQSWSPPSVFDPQAHRITRKGIATTLSLRPPPRLRSIRDGFTINMLCADAETFVSRMLHWVEAEPD